MALAALANAALDEGAGRAILAAEGHVRTLAALAAAPATPAGARAETLGLLRNLSCVGPDVATELLAQGAFDAAAAVVMHVRRKGAMEGLLYRRSCGSRGVLALRVVPCHGGRGIGSRSRQRRHG